MRTAPLLLLLASLAACRKAPPSATATADASPSPLDAAAAASELPWPDAGLAFDAGFAGHLGDRLTFRAQLAKSGDALRGYYRYPSSATALALAGTVDVHGRFTLAETNALGVTTGRWEGAFRSPQFAAGTWSSVDGKRRLPFTLTAAAPLAPLGNGTVAVTEHDEAHDAGHGCENKVSYPVVSGLTPASRNAKVNAALAKLAGGAVENAVTCDGSEGELAWWSESSVVVEAQAPGYLAVVVSGSSYSGGAHPIGGGTCVLVDTRTAAAVGLGDVFGPDALAVMATDTEAKVQAFLKDNGLRDDYAGDVSPSTVDGHLCYVDADHVEVRFNPYEVAPYAFGAPSFAIEVAPLLPKMPRSPARLALFGK
jgi:hypothetical protein